MAPHNSCVATRPVSIGRCGSSSVPWAASTSAVVDVLTSGSSDATTCAADSSASTSTSSGGSTTIGAVRPLSNDCAVRRDSSCVNAESAAYIGATNTAWWPGKRAITSESSGERNSYAM